MFGVFDGHGGKEVAQYCKSHWLEILQDREEFKNENYLESLRLSFLGVDEKLNAGGLEEVAEMKRKNPPNKSPLLKILTEASSSGAGAQSDDALALDSIGCTANVVIIDEARKKLYVANAGDSRAVMGRAGEAVPLSFDHKPESQVEIDRIEKAGSVITDGRVDGNLNLTRAIGDLKYKQKAHLKAEEHPITANPDVFEYDFTNDCDFIVMGCDGGWEQKSNEEMVKWVYDQLGDNPQKADLSKIVSNLLNENLSEDHTMSSKCPHRIKPCRRTGLRQHDLYFDCL